MTRWQATWKRIIPGLAALLLAGSAVAAGGLPATPGLQDYLDLAASAHPEVAAARATAAALDAEASAQGALPPLRLGWGEMLVPVETRVGPQRRVFSLNQGLPWFGTLSLRRNAALERAAAAEQTVRARFLAVDAAVRAAWIELAVLQEQIRLQEQDLARAREAEAALLTDYRSGEAAYTRLLQARLEIGRLEGRLDNSRDRVQSAVARLDRAAGLAVSPGIPTAVLPDAGLARRELPTDAALGALLATANPRLGSLSKLEQGRALERELAGKAAYPELTFGLDYIQTDRSAMPDLQDSGKDPLVARLSVSLPLWGGRVAAGKQAAAARQQAAAADLAGARLELDARLRDLTWSHRRAGRDLETLDGTLLPTARQLVSVAETDYGSGRLPVGDLIRARRALLDLELERLRAAADRLLAINDLAGLTGLGWDDFTALMLEPSGS